MERSLSQKTKDKYPLVLTFFLVGIGLYTYKFYFENNFLFAFILLANSTISMFITLSAWRWFSKKYAHEIIYWTTNHKWVRKIVAGGSYSYYEYQKNIHKISLTEPITRFINLTVSFLSLASTFASVFNLKPENPVNNVYSVWVWSLLIIIVPLILTPIIPIIWTMEDLQLKAWNNKFSTNVRISSRYKARFNSFIAVGALGAAFTLGSDPTAEPLANLTNFGLLLLTGVRLLIYPISVLTLLYYLYFRETVRENVKNRIDMPIAETKLIFRNFEGDYLDAEGNVLFDNSTIEEQDQMVIATAIVAEKKDVITSNEEKDEAIEDLEPTPKDEIKPLQKVGKSLSNRGKSVKRSIKILGKNVNDNTVGRLFKKNRAKKIRDKEVNANHKKKFKKGSATEDLWEHEENETGEQYKYQGGSATKDLWDETKEDG